MCGHHSSLVDVLITTNGEMKKKNTGITVKDLQLKGDFGGRIGRLFIVLLSERCIHEDRTEVVVKKDDKTVLLFIMC